MTQTLKDWAQNFFFYEQGGKRVICPMNVGITVVLVGFLVSSALIGRFLLSPKDTSHIEKVSRPIDGTHEPSIETRGRQKRDESLGGVKDVSDEDLSSANENVNTTPTQNSPPIQYKAKQVIVPQHGGTKASSMPTGTSFVGKTLNAIDTRTSHKVKVILPYGGSHKQSGAKLPQSTILLGRVSYSGNGKRVHIRFHKGILPSGIEFSIKAEALSSKDYSPGVIGKFHGNTGNRMASVLGLSMVSGMSEVLVEKEALGQGYSTTPKATLKNGLYNGVAKVAGQEAKRQAEKLDSTPVYVTVKAGSDLIVSLTGEFKQQ